MEWIMELVMNYLNDEKIVVIVQNDRKLLLNFFSNALSFTARIRLPTQTGMMILPPLSLPYGGHITYVNPAKYNHSRSSSARHRSLSKQNNEQIPITTTIA